MSSFSLRLGIFATVFATSSIIGCGGTDVTTAPVSGTVTVNGKPQANLVVSFLPVSEGEENPGPGSTGTTDASGRYRLKPRGAEEASGAVVGKHQVMIRARQEVGVEDAPPEAATATVTLPPRATDGSLTVEVPKEGLDSADFQL